MTEHTDVVVVGGGTAGLQAALQLAKVGRSVVLLERRPAGKSGARWCNGVVPWQFERAGLAPSQPPELRGDGVAGAAHMISPSGRHRFTIENNPIGEADMRALVERLQREAEAAGVDIRWGVTEVDVALRFGRPVSLRAQHGDQITTIAADLFVDASGRSGALRSQVPALASLCPPADPADTCSAQQLILEIADPDEALRFVKEQAAEPGDALVSLGMEGGYSTINIKVESSLDEVSVLTGSIPSLGHATGPEMLTAVRERHPWIGAPVFGGGGLIPLRRVYDRFTAPGVALVGDAASQVMPGHGSGIGFGLIAGKILAEAVSTADDPGAPDVLWTYQATYLREFGAILSGYDAIRRMSVKLGTDGVEELFASGIFSPPLVLPGLEQKLGLLSAQETFDAARTLAGRPKLAKVVLPALNAMGMSRGIYAAYPRTPSPRAFRAWAASAHAILPRQS